MNQAKPKILVSACLLGEPVRYDGQSKGLAGKALASLAEIAELVSICPEMAGKLPVPRPAAELMGGDGRMVWQHLAKVVSTTGEDVSQPFMSGALQALAIAQQLNCRMALLMARSPSCGNQQVYDGTFSGQLIEGMGVTTALLTDHGIRVFNPTQLDELQRAILQATEGGEFTRHR